MYISVGELYGWQVNCRDGAMGTIQDVVLSRRAWQVRYVVVNLGPETPNARVLLPVAYTETIDARRRRFGISLTCGELEWAAPYDPAATLTAGMQQILARRHGWQHEWLQDAADAAAVPLPPLESVGIVSPQEHSLEQMLSEDPVTQAARAILSFTALTRDRQAGSLETLVVDARNWTVAFMVVRLGRNTKPVAIHPRQIGGIDWLHKQIHLVDSARKIQRAPRYNSQTAGRMAMIQRMDPFCGPDLPATLEPDADKRPAAVCPATVQPVRAGL